MEEVNIENTDANSSDEFENSVHPFDALLQKFRDASDTNRMQGNYFEQFVKLYLLNDAIQSDQYEEVWLWSEWPERANYNMASDIGIDLVAKRKDGGITGIQAKFYREGTKLDKKGIDSFIAALGQKPFTNGLIIDTTGTNWSSNLEEQISNQTKTIQRIGLTDLRNSNIDWNSFAPEKESVEIAPKKTPRPHQDAAISKVINGFNNLLSEQKDPRGQLIMACGTGKTFTSLKIAEKITQEVADEGQGAANILFLVPSLALLQQSLKEWSEQTETPMHSYAICSDNKIGRKKGKDDDITDVQLFDLQIPATTNSQSLLNAVDKRPLEDGMRVFFSTYQSIDVIHDAQMDGLPSFDLIICDEAHRTTGATLDGNDESNFVKVHDNANIMGTRRLYMTATPRVYNANAKSMAKSKDAILASMDDVNLFGERFHYIGFGQAVQEGLLTDYKVLVLHVSETLVTDTYNKLMAKRNQEEMKIDEVAKLVGCWNGLAKRKSGEFEKSFGDDTQPMKRAVAFNCTIKTSQSVAEIFKELVNDNLVDIENDDPTDTLRVETNHVDGGDNAVRRSELLDWLKEETEVLQNINEYGHSQTTCRILSNARCLTEGVDVPNLDAVMFLNPRNSQADVIQAVGRVMRSSPGKKYGYIILPIAVPPDSDDLQILNNNDRYKVVWQVLQALRAHDERLEGEIARTELEGGIPEQIIIEKVNWVDKKSKPGHPGDNNFGSGNDDDSGAPTQTPESVQPMFDLDFNTSFKDAVNAQIVKKVGNRMYWDDWASDIAKISQNHIELLQRILDEATPAQKQHFADFVQEFQDTLNPSINEGQCIEMLAQHLITKPIFDALFGDYEFSKHNSISQAIERILEVLEAEEKSAKERANLAFFYASMKEQAKSLKTLEGKQNFIKQLYDKFYNKAFPKMAEQLGVVFTPVEVVDYIIKSAEFALKQNFGKSMSDKGVSVIDPFTGTGTFITRLLQLGIIKPEDMELKFKNEIFANEIVLLSYYIASINIESVYHELQSNNPTRLPESHEVAAQDLYTPFKGIALTDTFNMYEDDDKIDAEYTSDNRDVIKRQKDSDIQVIIMNPPYSAGADSMNDLNENQSYPGLDKRIEDTYVLETTDTKDAKTAYDSYMRALRWASDRIGDQGVLAFVSNSSFLNSKPTQGLRKTFQKEFTDIYIYNLRGDLNNKSKEGVRQEGGNVFPIRTGVAITILVKNPNKYANTLPLSHPKLDSGFLPTCQVHYFEVEDYATSEDKIRQLVDFGDISQTVFNTVEINDKGDWLGGRADDFEQFVSICTDKSEKGIFEIVSAGVETSRDSYVYNFSRFELRHNIENMCNFFNSEITRLQPKLNNLTLKNIPRLVNLDKENYKWSDNNFKDIASETIHNFDLKKISSACFRPFCKEFLYRDYENRFVKTLSKTTQIFPTKKCQNVFFTIEIGSDGFSAIAGDLTPDLQFNHNGKVFPLYTYEPITSPENKGTLLDFVDQSTVSKNEVIIDGYRRKDNITDATLADYRSDYANESITKEDIFYYVYGLLHHPEYKSKYAYDLSKMLPRIPKMKAYFDFRAISDIGRKLADLHVNYETVDAHPNVIVNNTIPVPQDVEQQYDHFAIIGKMKYGRKQEADENGETQSVADKTQIIYNDHITLTDIPQTANDYVVNGKPALDWLIDRYHDKIDKSSQIRNNCNDYLREANNGAGNPRYILDLIRSVTTVATTSVELVAQLPKLDVVVPGEALNNDTDFNVDEQALTIMGVEFDSNDLFNAVRNALGSSMYEGFKPNANNVELIRDVVSGKISMSEYLKSKKADS
jgi:predicted helicase